MNLIPFNASIVRYACYLIGRTDTALLRPSIKTKENINYLNLVIVTIITRVESFRILYKQLFRC